MQFTFVNLVILFSCASSYFIQEDKEKYEPSPYKFEYGVHDPHTQDIKSQWEQSDGHTVKGVYTLKEPDGTTRTVEYIAGPKTGFQAIVKREGKAQHPEHVGKKDEYHGEGGGFEDGAYSGSKYSEGEHSGGSGIYSAVGVIHYGH